MLVFEGVYMTKLVKINSSVTKFAAKMLVPDRYQLLPFRISFCQRVGQKMPPVAYKRGWVVALAEMAFGSGMVPLGWRLDGTEQIEIPKLLRGSGYLVTGYM